MAMRRAIPVALGSVALLATVAIIGVLAVLSTHTPQTSGRASSQVSLAVEAVVFVCVGWLVAVHAVGSIRYLSSRCLGVDQGLCLLAIVFATVAGVATLIQLSKATVDKDDNILGSNKNGFLMGASIALGISFAFQSIFLLLHFLHSRSPDMALSLHSLEEERKSPINSRVKAVRYSQTTPDPEPLPRLDSMTSQAPSSFGGRSRSGTMTSIKSSLSNAIRPVTSKTQLITKESRRPASIDFAGRRTSTEDAFDSWDTSSVDTQNRQVVMEMSTPPQPHGRFLETIPGSPTVSRTPSPNVPAMPFEPPRIRPRSRSYSPSPRRVESPIPQPPPSMSEMHIHPLFRSDSPDPPPVTTPGTVVIASPNAGQVITHRQSVRSLNQTRVSSNPIFSSPLSHDGNESSLSIREEDETETEVDTTPSPSERTVTPPIPDWVLGAGTRSSWAGYNVRKVRTESEERDLEESMQRRH
ncbi:hypothetical protein B0T10DRAFT_562204 [Thelonectria olida]|uniref:Uncharacterized protein n=1 Tax=Thelonectria olida TaxID=1576542 RepID=A0A9P8W5X6_9HYPO|nr:hypothetical protein B0T10DRAFT_562204 [Thelonectria olida]